MNEPDFAEILNDCVDKLAAGQNLKQCLSEYPRYKKLLYALLEAGLLVQEVSDDTSEVETAREQARMRVLEALYNASDKKLS